MPNDRFFRRGSDVCNPPTHMESGRPILAAVGLFFGGLLVGSSPGGGRDGSAHAAVPPAQQDPRPDGRPHAERGPVSDALRKLASGGRDAFGRGGSDVEPPAWSTRGASRMRRAHDPKRVMRDFDDPDDPLAGLRMPDLPIPRVPQVLKYVRYFSESYEGRKVFAEAFRRSGRFQEIIARALRELGLPQDLIAVAFIESGFSTEAISTAGAAGLWQFMPSTARAYGLAIETTIDERLSIWRSTEAAARHLADLHERFRSWELALAAYNMGYDALERRLDDFETDDFWTLAEAPGALPKETTHYVPKVLATAVVFANAEELGFGDVERAPAIDASELEVPGGTHLSVVARAAGTSLRVIRELNPELLADVVPDRSATAIVHVPRGGLARARAMLPKLALDGSDAPAKVSEDFDWGKDDVRTGRSRLERASLRGRSSGAHAALGARSTRRRLPQREEAQKAKASALPPSDAEESRPVARAVTTDASARTDEGEPTTRVLYRVVAGDSIQQIAATVGLTVDQVLAQAVVTSAADIKVGTLLDLRVPSSALEGKRLR